MNAVIWARVSSREQQEGYSLDAQLRATRERAARNGWRIAHEFSVAESAKRGAERQAFNEMYRWVRSNARREKIDIILSHKLDRVCRNIRDAVRMQELEDTCGVHLAFVENEFGQGAAGALSFNVMAAVAQYYSDNLRSEVLKGIDEKVKQGWPTGLAPYGYLNVKDKNEPIQPHPKEAQAVTRIFEYYSTGRYTFEQLAERLTAEGHVYRPSQPKFRATALSYILNNRYYTGEIKHRGRYFPGKHRLLISPPMFDACQDLLHGRNHRRTKCTYTFSGGLFRCGICGYAMTGELINRKIRDGTFHRHLYYRCANNRRNSNHPPLRWREEDIEREVLREFSAFKMPPDIAAWFRESLQVAFADVDELQRQRKQALGKRRTELKNMQDRLLNGYLAGAIEEGVFQEKTADLKRQMAEVEESLDSALAYDPGAAARALGVFDFSQKLVELWGRSNMEEKREILECVCLNRTLTEATLILQKRKPFDLLAERPLIQSGRGDWIHLEPIACEYKACFKTDPEQYIFDFLVLMEAVA